MDKKIILMAFALCIPFTGRADVDASPLGFYGPLFGVIARGILKRIPYMPPKLALAGGFAAAGGVSGVLGKSSGRYSYETPHESDYINFPFTVGVGFLTLAALKRSPKGFPFCGSWRTMMDSKVKYKNSTLWDDIYRHDVEWLAGKQRLAAYTAAGGTAVWLNHTRDCAKEIERQKRNAQPNRLNS